MAHPVVMRRVPNGPALTAEIVMEMNRSMLRRLSRTPHPGLTSAYLSLSGTSMLLMRRRKPAKSDESTAGRERSFGRADFPQKEQRHSATDLFVTRSHGGIARPREVDEPGALS
jgi:hypothetical protein